jgi:peptidyl-prolyl cis-trans isomerase B (cyclophilin B)
LVSVITGHVAISQIKQTGEGGKGMATAGLIMSYIGLGLTLIGICVSAVLAALGTISLPYLNQ